MRALQASTHCPSGAASRRSSCTSKPLVSSTVRARPASARSTGSTKCHGVKLDAEMQAMLQGAIDRSTCSVADRVGIIGLKFAEEGRDNQELMEAAIQLGCYLRDYRHADIRGKTILELGSGIGVAGLTAAAFGGTVLLTDLPSIAPLTAKNVARNADLVRGCGGLAEVAPLDWSAPHAEVLAGPWEYIIGSDLVYDASSPALLAPLLSRLLSAHPRATLLLSHVHRDDALDEAMTAAFASHGLGIRLAVRGGGDEHHHYEGITIVQVVRE